MSLFQPAENTSAFLKMGLLGFAGSGKTKTASITAIGLVQYARERKIDYAGKPVFFIDTETGSDWVKPDFDAAGIPLMVAKTRAFVDLLTAVEEAKAHGSLLLIDSISHFWKELCDSYSRRKAQQFKTANYRLQFQDWGYLKGEWGKFTDAFINSPLHIILCGRAGYEYDYFENDEGKRELEKTGVKMKAEGEMGYEPSLLVLMERNQKIESGSVTATWREATVLKDRSTLLDGKVFVDPTFKMFLPHIECLNLGGRQLGVDTRRTSEHAVVVEKKDWTSTQRKELVEQIQMLLLDAFPGQTTAEKQGKLKLLREHFADEELVWTTVEERLSFFDLMAGYDSLHRALKKRPSKYAPRLTGEKAAELNDELPEHSAPPKQETLRDKLLTQIAVLPDLPACARWMFEASDKYGDLPDADYRAVQTALMARQKALADQAEEAKEAKPEGNEDPPAKPRRNGKGKPELNVLAAD
jgi:hypothetical protein